MRLIRTILGFTFGWMIARAASLLARLHGGPSFQQTSNRRNFTRNAVLGAALLNLGVLGAGFLRFFWPNKTGAFGSDITIYATDIPPVGGAPFRYGPGKFYVVHNADGVMALYWKCPHLGCTVPWVEGEQQFHCPCHGSVYDPDGVLLGGPAPRSMDIMESKVVDGNLVVSTGKLKPARSAYDESQVTPLA